MFLIPEKGQQRLKRKAIADTYQLIKNKRQLVVMKSVISEKNDNSLALLPLAIAQQL